MPDKKAREEILDLYLGKKKGPDVDLNILSKHTAGMSGADLHNITNWAAIEAVKVWRKRSTEGKRSKKANNSIAWTNTGLSGSAGECTGECNVGTREEIDCAFR